MDTVTEPLNGRSNFDVQMTYSRMFIEGAVVTGYQEIQQKKVTGAIGFWVMLIFGIYLLFPHLFGEALLETETYILVMVWTVIGFFYFRWIIKNDQSRRFGKAIIVWIALLALHGHDLVGTCG